MARRNPVAILIGQRNTDHVLIEPSAKIVSGWFEAEISFRCGGWTGRYKGQFLLGELSKFGRDVDHVYNNLKCTAALKPMEPCLTLVLTGDGKRPVHVAAVAKQKAGMKAKLEFEFDLSQAELPGIASALIAADRTE